MLYRKVNTEFEAWFKGANKKALFVQGARQVGKTTTIREFCRSHYENFIELNFIKNLSFSIFCTKKSASRPWAWRDGHGDAWSA